jgi:hypothetical protein
MENIMYDPCEHGRPGLLEEIGHMIWSQRRNSSRETVVYDPLQHDRSGLLEMVALRV